MKTALITGGAKGLGYALREELIDRGFHVVVLDVVSCTSGPAITYYRFDLADFDPTRIEEFPELDLVICNAGVTEVGNFREMAPEADRRVMEINFIGHMNLLRYLLKFGKIKAKGHVAFTNSAAAYVPWPVGIAYAASKAALDGFSRALESYLSGMGISVTSVYPAAMRTEHAGYARQTGTRIGVEPAQIAPKIVRGILRRRRRIFPDALGKLLVTASMACPTLMSRWLYRRFEQDLK